MYYMEFTNEIDNRLHTMHGKCHAECKYYRTEDLGKFIQNKNFLKGALSAFHINCQSINAHWDKLLTLLSEVTYMYCQEFAFDLIGLTEIFQIHVFSDYSKEGYHPLIYKT